jgi:hypothetical protein
VLAKSGERDLREEAEAILENQMKRMLDRSFGVK